MKLTVHDEEVHEDAATYEILSGNDEDEIHDSEHNNLDNGKPHMEARESLYKHEIELTS